MERACSEPVVAMTYLARRLLFAILQLLAISAASFALFGVAPGDYYSTAGVDDPRRSVATVEALRTPARYGAWLRSCLHGDFGVSLAYQLPVTQLLQPRIARTASLAFPALLIAWILGLALSAIAARFDIAAWQPMVSSAALVPDAVAVSLLLWTCVVFGVTTTGMLLPLTGLIFALLPVIALHAGSELRAARQLEFVRLAERRGVSRRRLWCAYVLPAAANPLLSLAGLSISGAIGSSFLIEVLTGWPGLGPLFLEAVQARDYPIVHTVMTGLAAVLIVSNLLVDLALYRLDPRIRTDHA